MIKILENSNKKYSKIYKVADWVFRYNYAKSEIELLDAENKLAYDSLGLSLESFNENPKYWCEMYADKLDKYILDVELGELEQEI